MLYDEGLISEADELLSPNLTSEILEKAEKWLYYLADKLNVPHDAVKPGFIVQELITCYAFREICVQKSYSMPSAWNDGNSGDFYSKKLHYYENKIKMLEGRITAEDLAGKDSGYKGSRTISLKRC